MITTVFDTKAVQILCTCKQYWPLCRTYFCRYCYQVRCSNCITHEVDCYYCPTCLESMASGEANSRKDKCSNCFDCPSCGNMLSLRASVMQVPKMDESGAMKAELQKLYYMACSYCRWTTRESNIPDRKTSTNNWPEYLNPHSKRIKTLIECFNQFASKEKLDKERTKYASRKNYFFLMAQKMVLTITNPAHRITTVKLGLITEYTDEISTAKLDLPNCDLKIAAKNEIMGFDEMDPMINEFEGEDDPRIVVARKQNKLEFNVTVTPMKSSGPVVACVQMTFDYKDATSLYSTMSSDAPNPNDVSLRMVVYKLEFGGIVRVTDSDDK